MKSSRVSYGGTEVNAFYDVKHINGIMQMFTLITGNFPPTIALEESLRIRDWNSFSERELTVAFPKKAK